MPPGSVKNMPPQVSEEQALRVSLERDAIQGQLGTCPPGQSGTCPTGQSGTWFHLTSPPPLLLVSFEHAPPPMDLFGTWILKYVIVFHEPIPQWYPS